MQKLGGLDAVVPSPAQQINYNPNTTFRQYIIYQLRHRFGLMSNKDVKYLPFLARIVCNDDIQFLIKTISFDEFEKISKCIETFKKNPKLWEQCLALNIATYDELMKFMSQYIDLETNSEIELENGGYKIVEIPNFQEAQDYGCYTGDNEGGMLCYCTNRLVWDSYTDFGKNTVYVLLKGDWENMEPVPQENAPYDEYGLSMIFCIIAPSGKLITCNTRWNHGFLEGWTVDHALSPNQISELLGGNMYHMLPSLNQQKQKKEDFSDIVSRAEDTLQAVGATEIVMNRLFSNYSKYGNVYVVEINGLMNFMTLHGEFMYDEWFDNIDLSDGIAQKGENFYIFDKNGQLEEIDKEDVYS